MTDDALRIERLTGLCRVWGAVKFFHPYLAYRDIDWDAALVGAIPLVNGATSAEDFGKAVTQMLSALDDPATRLLDPAEPEEWEVAFPAVVSEGDPMLLWQDEVAVLQASQLTSLPYGPELSELLGKWFDEMEKATALILDLRGSGGYYVGVALANMARRLLEGEALQPAFRSRMHSGYTTDGGGSGGYSSGFYLTDALPIAGTGGPLASKPLAAILDAAAGTPGWVLALQADRARVIFAGDAGVIAPSEILELAEGLRVQMRTSELILPDGSVGFVPDSVTEPGPSGDDYFASPAMTAALEAVASHAPRPAVGSVSQGPITPYRREKRYEDSPYPDAEHRLLALFRYWTIMNLFFPYKEHLDRPWSETLAEGIPLMEAAGDETEYALALASVIAQSRDTHCFLYSEAFQRWMGATVPPMIVRLVEGRTVVTHLAEPVAGLAVGDVVLSVDGQTTESRRDRLRPYIAASTAQAMEWRLHNVLFAGEADSDAALEIEGTDGTATTVTVRRSQGYVPAPDRPLPVFGVLPSGFGYFDLARLMPHEVDDAFEAVRETPALIIDDRCYPNGTAWAIAPRLADGPVAGALFRRPEPRSPDPDFVHEFRFMQTLPASDKWRYKKPVVMLINGEAISQAEHTCLLIDAACQPTFIGSATNGANGDVTTIQLPGGVRTMFSGHDVRHADGRQLQRVGVQPHIEVHPTIAGIRAGRDEVLDAAVAFLTDG